MLETSGAISVDLIMNRESRKPVMGFRLFGTPEGIRIPDLPLRSMAYRLVHDTIVISVIIWFAKYHKTNELNTTLYPK